jgi:hypothetical protein
LSRTYVDRITTPVMMHQGSSTHLPCGLGAGDARRAGAGGADLTYYEYAGENHYMYEPGRCP